MNPMVRVVRSSSNSGLADQYDEQNVFYDQSAGNSNNLVYQTTGFNIDGNSLASTVITEEMLLRARESNGGQFPGDILKKLGSQVYYVPSEHIELATSETKTRSNARYYLANPGQTGYESQTDDFTDQPEGYQQQNFVELNASDLEKLASNYDLYSSSGQKLEGEQATF